MTAPHCPACSTTPTNSHSQAHLLACEARYLLAKPLQWRREYLEAKPVQARRKALEAELIRQHAARKQ